MLQFICTSGIYRSNLKLLPHKLMDHTQPTTHFWYFCIKPMKLPLSSIKQHAISSLAHINIIHAQRMLVQCCLWCSRHFLSKTLSPICQLRISERWNGWRQTTVKCVLCASVGGTFQTATTHFRQQTKKKHTHTNAENMEGMPANISSYPYPFEHNGNIVCYNIRILTRHSRIYNICYKCRLKRAKKLIGTTSTEHWLTFAFYGLHWSLCDMQECVLWTVCRGTQHMCHPPPTHRRHMRCVCMKYELLYT